MVIALIAIGLGAACAVVVASFVREQTEPPAVDPTRPEAPAQQDHNLATTPQARATAPRADVFVTPFDPGASTTIDRPAAAAPPTEAEPTPAVTRTPATTRVQTGTAIQDGSDPDRLIQHEVLVITDNLARATSVAKLAAGVALLGVGLGVGILAGFQGLILFFKAL